jgi:hypothetical protein
MGWRTNMTDYVNFQPTDTGPFQFQATLDGTQYNIVVTYNVYGQRYYVNIYSTQGTLIVARPMVGSPTEYDISLTKGYFTSTLVYRTSNQQFEISATPRTTNGLSSRATQSQSGLLVISTDINYVQSKLFIASGAYLRIH